jgi:hypothetical protein
LGFERADTIQGRMLKKLSSTSVGQFWMIDLFVWTLTGVSRKVDNGVVEGVGARSVMNIVQTTILEEEDMEN